MFSVDLDHLNILVMLILAFFSFRNYRGDMLALEYESEEEEMNENVAEEKDAVEVQKREDEAAKQCEEMVAEVSESPAEDIVLTQSLVDNTIPMATIDNFPQQIVSQITTETNEHCSQEVQQQLSTNPSSLIEQKYSSDQQESTLLNRITSNSQQELLILINNNIDQKGCVQQGQQCDEQDDEEIFSSDTSNSHSSSSSCCSSSVLGSQIGDDLLINGSSRKEKRKIIQKARRKLKKQLKRKQHHTHSQEVIRLIEF